MEKESDDPAPPSPPRPTSLFPLFAVSATPDQTPSITTPSSDWLRNASFITDLSLISEAVSSLQNPSPIDSDQEGDFSPSRTESKHATTSYELLEEEKEEDIRRSDWDSDSDGDRKRKKKKKKRRRKRKREDQEERGRDELGSRKSSVRGWANSDSKLNKEYYFDTHGDRDNLVYGCLYRMDVPNYKSSTKKSGPNFQAVDWSNRRASIFDRDGDIDSLDFKLKSSGRYWSAKYAAVERHKNLKRLRLLAPRQPAVTDSDNFIPFLDKKISEEAVDPGLVSGAAVVEESWEDEVLCKTREFNKLTRERPYDEKVWLDFAAFQDRVASMQPQKGARLQTLEKKISILEKATELNPDNEELLISLLKAYQSRDSSDVLLGRWEKVLIRHSQSYNLWKEYLQVVQGQFSRFKVSDMRKIYAIAIQALSTASNKQFRQVYGSEKPCSPDAAMVQLELGLVDIFLSLCRFEWQAGYHELATALFQAEIEFSLFCPSLLLSEHGKRRLFEHFWNSDGPRIGEEGAVGWSTWLEKEEENRQRILKEEAQRENDKGGWTGWSEPLSKQNGADDNLEKITNNDVAVEEFEEDIDNDNGGIKEEDGTEALLKQLGIDVDIDADSEVQDTSTWARWSEEELLRDCNQWMPVRCETGRISQNDGSPAIEADEQLSRVILFEDVCEHLFSLCSDEARFSLVSQFIEFLGGETSRWVCSNSSSWSDRMHSMEEFPDSTLQNLRKLDTLVKSQSISDNNSLEFLLGGDIGNSKRTDMMKFLRNAVLLCLSSFPRNYILQEAALVAEEMSVSETDSSTACQVLAKTLLKSDRQDVLLCGVYAQKEASFGNMAHARRVFDMALSSVDGLSWDLQSNAPVLYFWYAEAELANSSDVAQESKFRALHILSCLGSGTKYKPYESSPSKLQLLRAHQGFKDIIRNLQSIWTRGAIEYSSIALVCAAAIFEELTTEWAAGMEILDGAFAMVLPERRSRSYQLEFLFNYHVKMLQRHHKESSLSKVWGLIVRGLKIYPSSSELLKILLEIGHLYTTPNKLRLMLDDYCQKKPSIIIWIFALSFEMSRGGSSNRIHGLFERALANEKLRSSVILWRLYLSYEINIMNNSSAAKRVFFRAIHTCPWSKKLWLDGFRRLNSVLTAKELSDLQEVMRDKELNLRTDIYEILLQDEVV